MKLDDQRPVVAQQGKLVHNLLAGEGSQQCVDLFGAEQAVCSLKVLRAIQATPNHLGCVHQVFDATADS